MELDIITQLIDVLWNLPYFFSLFGMLALNTPIFGYFRPFREAEKIAWLWPIFILWFVAKLPKIGQTPNFFIYLKRTLLFNAVNTSYADNYVTNLPRESRWSSRSHIRDSMSILELRLTSNFLTSTTTTHTKVTKTYFANWQQDTIKKYFKIVGRIIS